jgi:hypothetical protein
VLIRRIVVALALVVVGVLAGGAGAHASGGGSCPPEVTWCSGTGSGGSGGGGGSGSGGGSNGCFYRGVAVPCYQPNLGYYHNGCYYQRRDPQPDPDSPIWAGHKPGTGAFYDVYCATGPAPWGSGQVIFTPGVWLPVGGATPEELAHQALAKIRLDNPAIGITPTPGSAGGLVGLPVWLWTPSGVHTWGPLSASASSGPISVTISASVAHIVWNMGNGHSVTCSGPGTRYAAAAAGSSSPTCGYRYLKPSTSKPGGTFHVVATTTWRVVWNGGGESGVITTTRTSAVDIRINQAQVIVK